MKFNIDKTAIKDVAIYLLKFIGIFCFFYYGSLFVIGAGIPGGHANADWAHRWFYYQDALRDIILKTSALVLELLGYEPVRKSMQLMRIGKFGIKMHDACLGMGVMSFWIAFIVANAGSVLKKLKWLFVGLFAIFIINVARVCLILLAGYHKWVNLGKIDHHAMFNIAAYILIFTMIYIYTKDDKKSTSKKPKKPAPKKK